MYPVVQIIMLPLIFLWILRLTVAAPHGIIFTRSPSQIGHFPISAKNDHEFNFASDLGNRNEKKISTAASNFDVQQLALEYEPLTSHTFRDLPNSVSPHSFKRTDLHLLGQIPSSVFKRLVDTSSLKGVPIVEDYTDEDNIGGDLKFDNYQDESEFSLQTLEQTKYEPSVTGVIYGYQAETSPLNPPSLIDQPEFLPLPDYTYKNNFILPATQSNHQLSNENDLGISPEIDEFEDYSDGSAFDGVSKLVSQPSASKIPSQNYQTQQISPEPTHLDFGTLRDLVPLAPPLSPITQNVPSQSFEQSNLLSQQYVSAFDGPNYPPPSNSIAYDVPSAPTSCTGSLVLSNDGICMEPQIIHSIHSFLEPKDDRFSSKYAPKHFVHKPKVKLNLVVIQANEGLGGGDPLIVPPPQEKTVVLVLKKDGEKERKVIEIPAPAGGSPEVFFVNYKEGENPTLPGGIDLQTALASSAVLGERIRSSSSISEIAGHDSKVSYTSSNYEGDQQEDDDNMSFYDTEYDGGFGDKIIQPIF